MTMQVYVLEETGYQWAMLGLSLSHQRDPERMPTVAERLATNADPEDGETKFNEFLVVYLDITIRRRDWQQWSTYRVDIVAASESTEHTIMKGALTAENFDLPPAGDTLAGLNAMIAQGNRKQLENDLPEGFLQRRIIRTSYKTLERICRQRRNHRSKFWKYFIAEMRVQLQHPELIFKEA